MPWQLYRNWLSEPDTVDPVASDGGDKLRTNFRLIADALLDGLAVTYATKALATAGRAGKPAGLVLVTADESKSGGAELYFWTGTAFRQVEDVPPPPAQRWQGAAYGSTIAATFAAGHGWTGFAGAGTGAVNLNDTATPGPFAAQSARITNDTASNSYVEKGGLALNLTSASITFWIKRTDPTVNIPNFTVYIGDSTLTNYYSKSLAPNVMTDSDGDWECYEVFPSAMTATGAPTVAALDKVRFRIEPSTPGSLVVNLGGITTRPFSSAYSNGVVTFSFDDSNPSDYTLARPTLAPYNFPATCYLIADQTTDAQILQYRQMQKNLGWEIAGHAYTVANHNTRYENLSAAVLEPELKSLRNWLDDNGFRSDAWASPGGTATRAVWTVAKQYFNSHRMTGHTIAATMNLQNPSPPQRPYFLLAPVWAAGAVANFQTAIDKAKASKSWMIFNFHGVTSAASSGQNISTADLNTIAAYCQSQGVAVRTVEQVLHAAMV